MASPLVGYNTNVRHHNKVFHIQTEDSGLSHGHIFTHLFADGGRIVATKKTTYSQFIGTDRFPAIVKKLMQAQHKAMFIALRDGLFDEDEVRGAKEFALREITVDDDSASSSGAIPAAAPTSAGTTAAPTSSGSIVASSGSIVASSSGSIAAPSGSIAAPSGSMVTSSGVTAAPTSGGATSPGAVSAPVDVDALERAAAGYLQPIPKASGSAYGAGTSDTSATIPGTLRAPIPSVDQLRAAAPAASPSASSAGAHPAARTFSRPVADVAPAPAPVPAPAPAPARASKYGPTQPVPKPASSRPRESLFGGDLLSEKSLDEVIMSYLAEDLDSKE